MFVCIDMFIVNAETVVLAVFVWNILEAVFVLKRTPEAPKLVVPANSSSHVLSTTKTDRTSSALRAVLNSSISVSEKSRGGKGDTDGFPCRLTC